MTMPPPLPDDLLASLPEAVRAYVGQLPALVAILARRVLELEAKLGSNSSKPPSSNLDPEAIQGFGPRLQAALSYHSGVGRLGKRAIRQLMADLHGIPISLGSISNLEARTLVRGRARIC